MKTEGWNATIFPSRSFAGWLLALVLCYWAVLLNWGFEWIRLASPLANCAVLLGALAIPIAIAVMAMWLRGWRAKLVSSLLAFPFVACSLVLGPLTWGTLWDIATTGTDPGFERLRSISMAHCQVTLYRTNGGATTSFGVAIRQEKPLLPGVLLVKRLEGFYPAYDAELVALAPDKVKVSVPGFESRPSEEVILVLKRFVYL